jgi:hypothetical protein
MFVYCIQRLHLSEAEAYLRITAARAAREHPLLLAMVQDGSLHLSAIVQLAPHLTLRNCDEVLARARHRSKRQILELVAELSPQADAPDVIRRLPASTRGSTSATDACELRPERVLEVSRTDDAGPTPGGGRTHVFGSAPGAGSALGRGAPHEARLSVQAGSTSAPRTGSLLSRGPSSVVQPLAPGRYRVQFTASAALRDKLERLQTLLCGHGEVGLAAVIEAAVDEKLQRLEAKRRALTARPRKALESAGTRAAAGESIGPQPASRASSGGGPTSSDSSGTRPTSRAIPAAVVRTVWRRDDGRCRFVGKDGSRCGERRWLELHHVHPYGVGGGHAVNNIRLMCKPHHRHITEADYGSKGAPPSRRGSRTRSPVSPSA